MRTLKQQIKDEAFLEIYCQEEDRSIELCINDDEAAGSILADMLRGNRWAWCKIMVALTWHHIRAVDTLPGCSYRSEKDFIDNSGYYEDMVNACADEIEKHALEVWHDVEEAKEKINNQIVLDSQ